jgi:hypothetical protein
MEIGKRYKVWSKVKIGKKEYLYTAKIVHVFPAYEIPDETLIRVYMAGPAGEPPPAYQYKVSGLNRWVMTPDDAKDYRRFVTHHVPNKYIVMEALHDNP